MYQMDEYRKIAEEMLAFIEKSPTSFHVTANLGTELTKQGFRRLEETERWQLEPGKGYFVTRN